MTYTTQVFDPDDRQEAITTVTPQRTATYAVAIDWANDGNFTGTYDDVTPNVLGSSGLVIERGRDQQRASGDVMVPTSTFTLSNADGTYNPQRGPLSSSLLPGRPVKITATYGQPITMEQASIGMQDSGFFAQGETTVPLFRGVLDEISVNPSLGARTVDLRGLGMFAQLRGRLVQTTLYQDITTGAAMDVLLKAVGLTEAEYVIDPYAVRSGRLIRWWWLANVDAYDAAVQLLDTEGPPAALYEDGQGRVVFESRLYRSFATRSTKPQGYFRDSDDAGFYLTYSDIRYQPGLRDIVNDVPISLDVRTAQTSLSTVWSYNAEVLLAKRGSELFLLIETTDPFFNAQTPSLAAGDFTVDAPPPGSFGVAAVNSVTLSQTSGSSTMITFSVTGSPVIRNLRLRAQSVPITATVSVQTQINDAITASRNRFGIRSRSPNVVRTLSVTDAQGLSDVTAAFYCQLRPVATISFSNINNVHMVQALSREVSDRIHVIASTIGVDDDYMVEQITHEIREAGSHTVALALEKAPDVLNIGQWLGTVTAPYASVWGADSNTTKVGVWG